MFLKIVSFDIEVLPLDGQMPNAEVCPILLISCVFNHDFDIDGTKVRKVSLLLGNEEKITISDNELIHIYTDESRILYDFFDIIKKCSVVTGYNINGFDWVYIIDRSKALGIKNIKIGNGDSNLYYRKHLAKGLSVYKISGLNGKIIFDVLYLLRRDDASNKFKRDYNLKRLTLEHVSREILGEEKIDFPIERMTEYWNDGNIHDSNLGLEMVKYCVKDAELALEFVTRFKLLDRFITLSIKSGKCVQDIINSMGSGLMVENLILKHNTLENRVTPIRSKRSDISGDLKGAEVFPPKLGITENVGIVDYTSLYPTIMISHNLCYSTVITDDFNIEGSLHENIVTELDENNEVLGYFINKAVYVGTIPKILIGLLDERRVEKAKRSEYEKGTPEYRLHDATQEAIKILLNSFYGYSGDKSSKTYNFKVASSVTGNGRKQVIKTKDVIVNEIGTVVLDSRTLNLTVAFGDTDSCAIEVANIDKDSDMSISRDDVIYCINIVTDKVNEVLEKPMKLAFESYVKRIIIIAKKRYAILTVDNKGNESIVTKGLESIRMDWCNFATTNMEKVISIMLKESNIEDGVSKCIELVKSEADKLNNGLINKEALMMTNKLTKPLEQYNSIEPHTAVAYKMKERNKPYEVGDRIPFLIIENNKKLISDKAEEYDYVIEHDIKIDYYYYIENQLVPPIMRILSMFGIKTEYLMAQLDRDLISITKWL